MKSIIQSESGWYKLTRRLFVGALLRTLCLSAVLIVLTLLFLRASVTNLTFAYAYESLIQRAGIRYVFLVMLMVEALLSIALCYVDNFKNGGIYTLMMLPIPRRHVFLAFCLQGVLSVLILWCAQAFALLIGYPLIQSACRHMAQMYELATQTTIPFALERTNGLFLAFVRSDLFHILLPQNWVEGFLSLLSLLAFGCTPAYVLIIGQKSAPIREIVFLLLALVATMLSLTTRFNWPLMAAYAWTLTRNALMTTAAIALTVSDGIRRLNKDASLV